MGAAAVCPVVASHSPAASAPPPTGPAAWRAGAGPRMTWAAHPSTTRCTRGQLTSSPWHSSLLHRITTTPLLYLTSNNPDMSAPARRYTPPPAHQGCASCGALAACSPGCACSLGYPPLPRLHVRLPRAEHHPTRGQDCARAGCCRCTTPSRFAPASHTEHSAATAAVNVCYLPTRAPASCWSAAHTRV
jgi:hypothetical protein